MASREGAPNTALMMWSGLAGILGLLFAEAPIAAEEPQPVTDLMRLPLAALIRQAEELGLPAKFLKELPPDFVSVTFEDLRRWGAEYHPEGHLMVLNRALSFNQAAGTLRPLAQMAPLEVGNLYHELYHAYMDYLESQQPAPHTDGARLLAAAKRWQDCRYTAVQITPIVQRRMVTEVRYLSQREAWEALQETWGVFVGWAIWTTLELRDARGKRGLVTTRWLKRLEQADRDGLLVGYYEPEDENERRVAQKRYLAPAYRISPEEVRLILILLFGEAESAADRAVMALERASPLRSRVQATCP